VCKAHRLVYNSTLGSRVIKKKKRVGLSAAERVYALIGGGDDSRPAAGCSVRRIGGVFCVYVMNLTPESHPM